MGIFGTKLVRALADIGHRELLSLPWPPSANGYWRHTGNRVYLTAAAKRFISAVAERVKQRKCPWGNIRLDMMLFPPDKRRRDLDNFIPLVLDALTRCEYWQDDSMIDEIHAYRGAIYRDGKDSGAVTLYVSNALCDAQ